MNNFISLVERYGFDFLGQNAVKRFLDIYEKERNDINFKLPDAEWIQRVEEEKRIYVFFDPVREWQGNFKKNKKFYAVGCTYIDTMKETHIPTVKIHFLWKR